MKCEQLFSPVIPYLELSSPEEADQYYPQTKGHKDVFKEKTSMKEYKSDAIRNIAIVSHARAGKTSLTEALLYDAGAIDKLGKVDNGTTVSDFDEEEIQRKTSIESSLCIC